MFLRRVGDEWGRRQRYHRPCSRLRCVTPPFEPVQVRVASSQFSCVSTHRRPNQTQAALRIREDSHDMGAAFDLFVPPPQDVGSLLVVCYLRGYREKVSVSSMFSSTPGDQARIPRRTRPSSPGLSRTRHSDLSSLDGCTARKTTRAWRRVQGDSLEATPISWPSARGQSSRCSRTSYPEDGG